MPNNTILDERAASEIEARYDRAEAKYLAITQGKEWWRETETPTSVIGDSLEDIPALCATVKQLRADIEKARELVTAWHVQCDEMEPEVNRTWDDDGALRIRTIRKLADELSLTLDQVKPGEM